MYKYNENTHNMKHYLYMKLGHAGTKSIPKGLERWLNDIPIHL